jgi:hypothetical protein
MSLLTSWKALLTFKSGILQPKRDIQSFPGMAILPILDALFGAPPKTIWIHRENAPTSEYERLLRKFHEQIEAFQADPERTLLIIN